MVDDSKIELLGEIDELNCMLGVAYGYADVRTRNLINETQAHLYMLGEFITVQTAIPMVTWIEVMDIDILDWNKELPALDGFIKPRAYLQLCKAICRRAARRASAYNKMAGFSVSTSNMSIEDKEEIYTNLNLIEKFLNKLSDWLFILARRTDQMI